MAFQQTLPATGPQWRILHRVDSKRSLFTTARSSKLSVRRKCRGISARLRERLTSSLRARNACDYFSTKLPPEVRLAVYSNLLRFDAPLRLVPYACGAFRPRDIDILYTNRLIHAEALSILYELNAITISRATFCTNKSTTTGKAYARPNHDLVRNLHISNLAPSSTCSALTAKGQQPCVYCGRCLLPLIRILRDMPGLRAASIDYHAHADTITKLATSLSGTYGRATSLRLTCTGVGKYTLTGPWFPHARVELRDTLLSELWPRLTAAPPRPTDGTAFTY